MADDEDQSKSLWGPAVHKLVPRLKAGLATVNGTAGSILVLLYFGTAAVLVLYSCADNLKNAGRIDTSTDHGMLRWIECMQSNRKGPC